MKRAYSLARALVWDHHEAEDCSQEAFVKAYENLDRFDLSRRFGRWFFTIVRNKSLNCLRSRRRRIGSPQGESVIEERPDPHPDVDPVRNAGQVEDQKRVRAAIRELPDHYRAVVVLDSEGYRNTEIAEMLEIKASTVGSRLCRAYQLLKTQLERKPCTKRIRKTAIRHGR
jgi:RNA polymerase sigma-70 factor (ECF subfamily)